MIKRYEALIEPPFHVWPRWIFKNKPRRLWEFPACMLHLPTASRFFWSVTSDPISWNFESFWILSILCRPLERHVCDWPVNHVVISFLDVFVVSKCWLNADVPGDAKTRELSKHFACGNCKWSALPVLGTARRATWRGERPHSEASLNA